MKKLVLMRHGKSSWEFDVPDDKRPLKTRGKSDAKLVSNEFLKISELPDKIFSSPAKRALDTCKIFTDCSGISFKSVQIVKDLYDFGGNNVINFLKRLPNTLDTVMIFGHNHAFTSISNVYGSTYLDNLPTSGLVIIELDIDSWKTIENGKTKHIIIPKNLR